MQRLQLLIFVDSISGLWDFWVYMFRRISFLIENTCFNSTISINMFTEWRLVPSTKMLLWCNGYIYMYIYTYYTVHKYLFHLPHISMKPSTSIIWQKPAELAKEKQQTYHPINFQRVPPPPEKKKGQTKTHLINFVSPLQQKGNQPFFFGATQKNSEKHLAAHRQCHRVTQPFPIPIPFIYGIYLPTFRWFLW